MVVAYLRVSTGKQNLANQQDEIRRFAAARGIVVDRWVTEVVSGRKNESWVHCWEKCGWAIR